jgi:hypothetical protein
MATAAAIYSAHVAETRAHFARLDEQAYERWLTTDMSIVQLDGIRARLRASLARYLRAEVEVYYLNLAAERAAG